MTRQASQMNFLNGSQHVCPQTRLHPTSQFQRERLEDEKLNSSRDAPSLADELFEWSHHVWLQTQWHPKSQFQRKWLGDENLNPSRDAPSLGDKLLNGPITYVRRHGCTQQANCRGNGSEVQCCMAPITAASWKPSGCAQAAKWWGSRVCV